MADDHKYPHVARVVYGTPWAILETHFTAIRDVVDRRLRGEKLSAEEIQARIGSGPARKDSVMVGSTAVIPIFGVIMPRADMMTEMSGGTSVDRLVSAIRGAASDPDVSSILLDVDSPGGQTDLLPEAAAAIRDARKQKPVVAIANTTAASAAYWLGSQASEFVVTPSGKVGSIGVFAAHEDVSAAMEAEGVKTTLISAGKYKVETSPYGPLSDEARAHVQSMVDDAYQQFTLDVAKGRGVSVDTVRGGFGEGRTLTAKQALKAGMVDGVETLDNVLGRLSQPQAGRRGTVAVSMYDSTTTATSITAGTTNFEVVNLSSFSGPIAAKSTATSDAAWDGPANKARLRNGATEAYYRSAFAWQDDTADATLKGSYKFIHHEVNADGDVGAANLTACSQGIAVLNGGRTGTTIPKTDRQGVYNHLARHLRDAGREPPPLQSFDESPDMAATSGLSFAAKLRATLRVVEEHVATARGFADVQAGHLTAAKREQFVAVADALGEISKVEGAIQALLAETDPDRSRREAEAAAAAFHARRYRERTAS